jgi:DNA-binding beta-propeller fold protein YncE
MKKMSIYVGMVFVLSAALPSGAAKTSAYTVDGKIHVEGDLGWDLLTTDDSAGIVYLSHGDRVQAVDVQSGKLLGTISGINGAHGVALVPEAGKGFATSGKDSTVVLFDTKTFATLARLPAGGPKPDAIIYDAASKRVFVGLADGNALGAIDVASSKIVGTVALAGNPELMAVDGKGTLYVAIENKSQVVSIDTRSLKVSATWPLAPGEEPTGLALDPVTNKLFAGCSNHMLVVLDAASGKVVAHLPIGDHIDGVVFDAGLKRVYASGGDGTLTVIQEDGAKFGVLETVATKKGARTIAIDAKTHHLYLPTADFGPLPAATAEHPKPRAPVLPGTFTVLDVSLAR